MVLQLITFAPAPKANNIHQIVRLLKFNWHHENLIIAKCENLIKLLLPLEKLWL